MDDVITSIWLLLRVEVAAIYSIPFQSLYLNSHCTAFGSAEYKKCIQMPKMSREEGDGDVGEEERVKKKPRIRGRNWKAVWFQKHNAVGWEH